MQKRVLLVEPDREQAEIFVNWLMTEGYAVESIDNLKEVHSSVSGGKFDILLIDLDYPEITEASLELCRTLKKEPRFQDLPIVVLTYKKDGYRIAGAIESGADSFALKPFETDTFLERIGTIFREIELKNKGEKSLDLNYINFLIKLTGDFSRNDFFLIIPVILNKLIIEKIKPIIGDSVIMLIINRSSEVIGKDYPFMRELKWSDGKILIDGVDRDSMEVDIERLVIAFRDFVYAFLHIVRMLTSNILMR